MLFPLPALVAIVCLADPPATAHLGLAVRDVPNVGCIVSWIDPGPLDGRGIESETLARPDLLVSIDGKAASGAALTALLAQAKPGDRVLLTYRKALTRGPSFPTALAHAGEVLDLSVTLTDPAVWRGTFKESPIAPTSTSPLPAPVLLALDGDGAFASALAQEKLREPLEKLLAAQQALCAANGDARRLSRVTFALEQPIALPELGHAIAEPATLAAARPVRCAAVLAAENLDAALEPFDGHGSVPAADSQGLIFALDFLLNDPRLKMQAALGDAYANDVLASDAIDLVKHMRSSLLVEGPNAAKMLAVIRRGAAVDMDAIVAALAHPECDYGVNPEIAKGEPEALRDELKGAVEGPILNSELIPDLGWAVVGGVGANRYDMSKIAAVFDLGGDDTFFMSGRALGMRAIVDVAGNDRYEGGADQGIGAGVCGFFYVDDRAGNDTYVGRLLNAGCGLFGAGLVVDHGGNDTYTGTEWSFGTGCWGAGAIIDRSGDDEYRSDYLSQGCGGPRGFGAIVDVSGNDRYDAEGNHASVYRTPGVRASFSQGIGIGVRRFASGGVGLLCDLAGNDRYEAGEFAQGGGYFFGLGALVDRGGNDRYWGNRYGQGFAAHQAAGILIEESGDDTYVGMTAASQGAAWDQSVALLLDKAGSDSYQADGLSQGSAAQQAIAFLVDLAGDDRYVAAGEIAQGRSGSNEYHFAEPPPIGGIWSFSALLNLGTGADHWSCQRRAHSIMSLGEANSEQPAQSTLHGLFIDVGQPNQR